MDPAIIVAMLALIVAGCYVVYMHHQLDDAEEACADAEEALVAADQAVTMYQQILTDVAYKQATLEVTHDGKIIATKLSDREIPIH